MTKMRHAAALALGIAISASAPAAGAQPAPAPGTIWNESEAGWQGVWTRVGRSNVWNAVWTKGNSVVRARLTITTYGNNVFVDRRDTAGPGVGKGCAYNGTLRGNAVTGTYGCDWSRSDIPWRATIAR